MSERRPSDARDALVYELIKLSAFLNRVGARIATEHGVSQQQSMILIMVTELGAVPQTSIRSELMYDRSNVSKAVSQLEAKRLVSIERAEHDQRITLVSATAEGRRVARECMASYKKWNRTWLQSVPSEELEQATRLLRRLTRDESLPEDE